MGELKHNFNAFKELGTKFFTNNVSFGHFHQVSMNSVTNCTCVVKSLTFYAAVGSHPGVDLGKLLTDASTGNSINSWR